MIVHGTGLASQPPCHPGMDRRRFLLTSLAGALAAPLAADAQPPSKPVRVARVGVLNYAASDDTVVNDFRDGLRDLGYVEGQNLAITYRWADGSLDRLSELARELVMSNVDVIIAIGPAVFSGDPVGNGVVSNLARPGGNVTGFSYMSTELAAKRLELLNRTFPGNNRIAILYNPDEPATILEMRETEAAARAIGVTLQQLATRHPAELVHAFATAVHERVAAVLVFTHGFAVLNRGRIIELAARNHLPTMYGWRDFVHEGGLMSYGPNIRVIVRKAASYVDRIIKGEQPGALPVEQPTKFELVINLKTAKALGLTIPPSLLLRADQVIE